MNPGPSSSFIQLKKRFPLSRNPNVYFLRLYQYALQRTWTNEMIKFIFSPGSSVHVNLFNMCMLIYLLHLLLPLHFIHFLPCYKLLPPSDKSSEWSKARLIHPQSGASPFRSQHFISRYDIIITEIMADPSPPTGLPEYEYIELKNNSSRPIDLKGLRLGDESSTASFTSSLILAPDSFLICCSNTAAAQLRSFGRCTGLSNFPSLANESDLVQLISPEGHIIHAVQYHTSWYRNDIKAEGGWSLEMINSSTPCLGSSNWSASLAPAGGTPGQRNSQPPGEPDKQPPSLQHTYAIDNTRIVAVFDEPLDSISAAQPKNYLLSPPNISPKSCQLLAPFYQSVQLQFQQPLAANTVHQLTVQQLRDCAGNFIGSKHAAKAGWATAAAAGDIIINEILFDPSPEGADYVELFNRSSKIIDLQTLFTSNRNNARQLVNTKPVSSSPVLIFPGDFVLLTENADWVQQRFTIKDKSAIRSAALPSLPNDQGSFVLSDAAGIVLDELHYAADWHFALLSDPENISLERIDPSLPAQDRHNWLSAAATAGGGTPGYINSQYKPVAVGKEKFQLSSSIFSPGLDGRDDLLLIRYQTTVPGTVGAVRIFDITGKPIRQLVSNALMGASGHWAWDGLSESKQPLASGIYIVQVQWFNQQGASGRWKQAVALVRRE